MAADAFLRKSHRVVAVVFLVTIPLAAWASFQGGDPANPSPLVYLPLFPLLGLTISGTYMLVRPWVLKRRARRMPG